MKVQGFWRARRVSRFQQLEQALEEVKRESRLQRLEKVLEEARYQAGWRRLEREWKGSIPAWPVTTEWQQHMEETLKAFRAKILPKLRPAKEEDYLLWLMGYLEKGGKPTHVYDRPFSSEQDSWYVAQEDIPEPVPLYGAHAIKIIVPVGISVPPEGWAHCELFYMDNFNRTGSVPIFEDTSFS